IVDARKTERNIGSIIGYTSTMEGTHSQLCSWLTDSLPSQHSDSNASSHKLTSRKVGPIAVPAHAVGSLTVERGSDTKRLDTTLQEHIGHTFIKQHAYLKISYRFSENAS